MLVTETSDLFGLRVSRLASGDVAAEFDGEHAAEVSDVADEIPFFLPAAGASFKALADGR